MSLTKQRLKALKRISKPSPIPTFDSGRPQKIGRGMLCEGCGEKTYRLKYRKETFYCDDCFDACIIREKQEEMFKNWDD